MTRQFDPLTCTWHRVWRHQRELVDKRAWDEDCDCGAPPDALHIECCSVTPIYAGVIAELGSVRKITDEIYGYAMRSMRMFLP